MTLGGRLRSGEVLHLAAKTAHHRRGSIRHGFSYNVDYLLVCPETMRGPHLLSHNHFNLSSIHDRDHGGPRGAGEGAFWARQAFEAAGLRWAPDLTLALLTQPRFLGYWFAPVSFWLVLRDDALLGAIAEVSNTFGQRHNYLCHQKNFTPIDRDLEIKAEKAFHVSPFQDVSGSYKFRFDIRLQSVDIHISHINGAIGLDATLVGPLSKLRNRDLLMALLRRPGGSFRVLAMIYWNAMRLKLKGASYRRLPKPPDHEIS